MSTVFHCGLAAIACIALAGCSSPYNSLITPQLISVVEEEQAAAQQDPNVCVDSTLSTHRSYLGGYRLTDRQAGIEISPRAGGRVDLANCYGFEGFVSIIPDVAFITTDVVAGDTMTLTASADRPTVFLVHTPDGTLQFAPYSDPTNGPLLHIELESGEYRLWVGTLDASDAFETTARLSASITGDI